MSLRFCVDCQKLNAVTVNDSYWLLRKDQRIDSLRGAAVFSTFDANSGCWQIEFARAVRNEMLFMLHYGIYRSTKRSSVPKEASEMFERTMHLILASVKWQNDLFYYLGDVLVITMTLDSHVEQVRFVFNFLQQADAL